MEILMLCCQQPDCRRPVSSHTAAYTLRTSYACDMGHQQDPHQLYYAEKKDIVKPRIYSDEEFIKAAIAYILQWPEFQEIYTGWSSEELCHYACYYREASLVVFDTHPKIPILQQLNAWAYRDQIHIEFNY